MLRDDAADDGDDDDVVIVDDDGLSLMTRRLDDVDHGCHVLGHMLILIHMLQ